jgi:hypothetical protein
VGTIEESVTGEIIGFVDILSAGNWLKHRSKNDIRIDNCKIKDWFVVFQERPLQVELLANEIVEGKNGVKRTAALSAFTLPVL